MSTVIRSDGSRSPACGVVVSAYNLEDMSQRAENYLQQVRAQADQIIAQAHEQAVAVRAQAKKDGQRDAFTEAESLATARAQDQLSTLLPALEQSVNGIQQLRAQCIRYWQQRAIGFAVAIAQRIVRRELTQTPEITERLIQETLELAVGNTNIQLHLNPQDHEVLSDRLPEIITALGKFALSDVIADPTMGPGGCKVTMEYGEIDQSIEAQLQRIEQELSP